MTGSLNVSVRNVQTNLFQVTEQCPGVDIITVRTVDKNIESQTLFRNKRDLDSICTHWNITVLNVMQQEKIRVTTKDINR